VRTAQLPIVGLSRKATVEKSAFRSTGCLACQSSLAAPQLFRMRDLHRGLPIYKVEPSVNQRGPRKRWACCYLIHLSPPISLARKATLLFTGADGVFGRLIGQTLGQAFSQIPTGTLFICHGQWRGNETCLRIFF
jgi:hypothetical protein